MQLSAITMVLHKSLLATKPLSGGGALVAIPVIARRVSYTRSIHVENINVVIGPGIGSIAHIYLRIATKGQDLGTADDQSSSWSRSEECLIIDLKHPSDARNYLPFRTNLKHINLLDMGSNKLPLNMVKE
jgi:hypothetical protein